MMGREVTATAGTGSKSHPNIAIQGTHRQNGDFFDSINPIATKSRTSRHFRFGPKGDIRNDAAVTFIGTPLCRELS